jgi:hypothetical protein
MAAKQSSPVVRVFVTLFTSLVAPTFVALITTAIHEAPKPDGTQTVSSYRGVPAPTTAPAPAVTLLPPAPVALPSATSRAPLVWRPVVATDGSATGNRNGTPRY